MIVIELRQAAKDKAFDLIDEMEDLGRQKKMIMCELKETLYDCFESSEEDEEYDSDEFMPGEEEDMDMDYRKRRAYKYGNRSMMRRMRDNEEDMNMDLNNRRSMRMRRRNRMGRFI